jgi:hypothetical protein
MHIKFLTPIFIVSIFSLFSQNNYPQSNKLFPIKYTISGYISDKETGERITGSIIQDSITNAYAISNTYGFYSITLPKGEVRLKYSYQGYNQESAILNLITNIESDIQLTPSVVKINEVTVTDKASLRRLESTQMSMSELQMKNIKSLPVLIGESDIMKTLQLLPGIQQGTEGSSSLYVRGGSADQNLILLDGAPVYNVNHLFGFMSTFNDDAIKSVTVLKGGIPARYGGRLSSVVEVKMKEGDNKKFDAQIAIGTLASRITLQGPIFNENTSFIISARRTYFDFLTRPIMKLVSKPDDKFEVYYYFQDYNLKLNHTFSSRSHLYFSLYAGSDVIGINQYTKLYSALDDINWGNVTATTRWNYKLTDKLFSNTTFIYSQYKMRFSQNQSIRDTSSITQKDYGKYESSIYDYAVKMDFDYYLNTNNTIRFGFQSTIHDFNPGYLSEGSSIENIINSKVDTIINLKNIPLLENDVYIEDEIRINDKLKANIGLRYSLANVQNKTYNSIQPRASLRYLLNDKWSAKAAWSVMNQNLSLLAGSSSIGLPMDLWIPATNILKPQHANLYSIGTLYAFDNNVEISSELYYKKMQNVIDFKDGTNYVFADNQWDKKIEQGKGISYGAEFMVEKKTGKTFGWLSYTIGKSMRQFDNINNGNWFPYQYDRRHNLNLVVTHRFSKNFEIGATWVLSSGRLLTVNNQKFQSYLEQGRFVESFDYRNNYQTPLYHRLDLSMSFTKVKKWGVRTWSIGCYNAYNQKNPTVIYVENNKLKQLASLPLIPSVTYTYKFKGSQAIKKDFNDDYNDIPAIDSTKMKVKIVNNDSILKSSEDSLNNISTPDQTIKHKRIIVLGLNYSHPIFTNNSLLIVDYLNWVSLDLTLAKFRANNYVLGSLFSLSYAKPFNMNSEFTKHFTLYEFNYGLLNRYYIGNMKVKPFLQITPSVMIGYRAGQILLDLQASIGVGGSCFISKRCAIEALIQDYEGFRSNRYQNVKFGLQYYFK